MSYAMAVAGLVLLFFGGELLVRGAVAVARRFGISPLVIGLTIVAAGTSAPELVVSLLAALDGKPDIALGNVVGSNIANILLILGAAAILSPMRADPVLIRRDGLVMIGASLLLVALALTGSFERWQGGIMIAGLLAFTAWAYVSERRGAAPGKLHAEEAEEMSDIPLGPWIAVGAVVGGIAILVAGSELLVEGAVAIATAVGILEAVIGLSLVAIGTSLPELATAIVAALRRHADVAIGNVIGSNIFNILGILGVTAVVTPIPASPQIAGFDMWVMLAVAVLLLPFLATGGRLDRREAALLLVGYAAYITWLYQGMGA